MIEPVHRFDSVSVGRYGAVIACVWDTTPKLEHAHFVAQALEQERAAHQRFALASIIGRGSLVPSTAVLDLLLATTLREAAATDAIAVVIDSDGFRGAAVRSVITAMSIAARTPFPLQAFTRCEGADAFLRAHCPSHQTPHSLEEAISALRSR